MNNNGFCTVLEIAHILGVTPEAIKKWIRELFPEILENGKITLLSEFHVTEIKKKLRPTTKVVAVTTDLEMIKQTENVITYWITKAAELKKQIEMDKPKVEFANAINDIKDCLTFRQFAIVLGIGRNDLTKKLRELKIIDKNNIPYSNYKHYFNVVEKIIHFAKYESSIRLVTLINGSGQEYLYKRLKNLDLIKNKKLVLQGVLI